MAPIRSIKFNQMWHKLEVREKYLQFTTARGYDPRKDKYYKGLIGKEIPIELKSPKEHRFLGRARLEAVRYSWSHVLPLEFIKADTFPDYTRDDFDDEMTGFYKTLPVFLILLHLTWTEVVE